jgi:cytochrome d ubiquinol oxidase subunit II
VSGQQALALAVAGAYFGLYALTAGVEFGAGLLAALARAGGHARAARLAEGALSPVWEVTNVFLILFALSLASFFPLALRLYGETLLMPVATALLLLLVRYVVFGFRHAMGDAAWPVYVYGVAGFLAPLPLMAFLPVSEGIGVTLAPGGGLRLAGGLLLASPLTWAILAATASSELALAGTLLAAYAARWQRRQEAAAFGRWARWALLAALLSAAAIWQTLERANPGHAARLALLWPLPAAAVPLGALTWWALARPGREALAMAALVLAYAVGLLGYALSHLPYLVDPELTVAAALTNGPMLAALIPTYLGGLALALPLAVWVYLVLPLRVPPPA